MSTTEFTWTPEMLARRRKIGITIIVIGMSILALMVYKIKVYEWRNEMVLSAALDIDPKHLQELLANGANCRATDVYGNSIIMRARDSGNAVRLLLENCADMSVEEKTAVLYRAADENCVGTVKVLLDKVASINDRSRSGWNALMVAASKGHFGVASLLSERRGQVYA